MMAILLGVSFTVIIIGLYGLIISRNLIKILVSIEIMFMGSMMMIAFIALLSPTPVLSQFIVFIIATIAALEEAVGAGLVIMAKKATGKIDAEVFTELKG